MEKELEQFYRGDTNREAIDRMERELAEMKATISEAAEEVSKVKELCAAWDHSMQKTGSVEELERGNVLLKQIVVQLRNLNNKLWEDRP